jgi:mRNA deadenylase 3'-5' endonuclease subunit Ccr4
VEKKDGCGIFFKDDRFKLVMERSINFKDQHDRVALMVLLEDRNGASSTGGKLHAEGEKRKRDLVLVTTTHLYWDSTKIDDQMKELREGTCVCVCACVCVYVCAACAVCTDKVRWPVGEGIEEMRLLVEREFKQSELSIFFCGDFNNSPQSPIYSYMRDEIGVRADPRSSTRMRSAYDVYGSLQPDQGRILLPAEGNAAGPQQEPTHTTVTSRRCWTIDYIWYNPASLRPTHLLEVPEVLSLSL